MSQNVLQVKIILLELIMLEKAKECYDKQLQSYAADWFTSILISLAS